MCKQNLEPPKMVMFIDKFKFSKSLQNYEKSPNSRIQKFKKSSKN